MKATLPAIALCLFLGHAPATLQGQQPAAPATPPPAPGSTQPNVTPAFDWDRAMALHRRVQGGETLKGDELTFYQEASRRVRAGENPNQGGRGNSPISPQNRRNAGGTFTPSEESKGLVPLTELTGTYKEMDGGLYGSGKNTPPPAQQKLADQALAAIKPLDAEGKPAASGKIVLMSIGMSNATQEFSTFVTMANRDSQKSPQVTIVDSAQGAQTAIVCANPDARPWGVAEERLRAAGVTPQQVQVLWIKQANGGPRRGLEEMKVLQGHMQQVVANARTKYPNVKLAFLASRTYGGYAQTPLNPEPYAYEGAFAMRGLILQQMGGDAALQADLSKGATKAPVLLWGPYLWGAGATPRKADGLTWLPEDFSDDGTHPSRSGQQKVGKLLLDFFTTDANANPWFMKK